MLFNSIQYLIFLPSVVVLYYLVPFRFRWVLLLVASCYFYMAFIPKYILILLFTIVIDFFVGIYLEKVDESKRKLILMVSLAGNVLVLFIFKYFNFFIDNFNIVANRFFPGVNALPLLSIILPIGLSFHTYQSMSYIIEVYWRKQKAEQHFGYYWLYVMFFPQLVAGPIERPQHLISQLHQEHHFSYQNLIIGLKHIVTGFFMKLVISDRLSIIVDEVYKDPVKYAGNDLLIATYFFAFQIYCDFAGYSRIAIGSSKIFGIDLMQNFRMPYFSSSFGEFWSRWHISLSSWFRDYVYIPLGGSRMGLRINLRNIFIVFLISGFWHGANWTYIIWGMIHSFFLILELITSSFRKKIFSLFRIEHYEIV